MRKLSSPIKLPLAGLLIATAFTTTACSKAAQSPTAPSISVSVIESSSAEPLGLTGHPCRDGRCKDTQNLTVGIVTFKPVLTFVVGATVTIRSAENPSLVLATGVTHRRGDVDFHIPDTYTAVLVDVSATGYCALTDYPMALPVRSANWIALTPGC